MDGIEECQTQLHPVPRTLTLAPFLPFLSADDGQLLFLSSPKYLVEFPNQKIEADAYNLVSKAVRREAISRGILSRDTGPTTTNNCQGPFQPITPISKD
jgi:hypothetical protein